MNKKKRKATITILILALAGISLFSSSLVKNPLSKPCAFCNQEILNRQTFYEDDLVLALYTHRPIFPGHCLVIPKAHRERFELLTEEEIVRIGQVIKKIDLTAKKVFGTSSYLLLQKNGKEVGQTVPHVHFHYISREIGDDSVVKFILKMVIAQMKKPLAYYEMEKRVETLKSAMDENERKAPIEV